MANCTVKAVAAARGVPYEVADQWLMQFGKPKGKGMAASDWHPFMFHQKWAEQLPHREVWGLSVREFCRKFKRGRFVVDVKGHAFAVVNGRPLDKSVNRHSRAVTHAWKVTRVPRGQGD